MIDLDLLTNMARNRLARRRLDAVAPSELYASVYATWPRLAMRRNADLREAAAAMAAAEAGLIETGRHHYDLVLLDKTPARFRARDRAGREFDVLDLVTNSYNDLEWVDANREALARFVRDAPLSSCVSRKIAGLHAVHDALRAELAAYMGYEACVLGTNGYISQASTIFALLHRGDVIFSDQHNHSSLVDGCRLSHARVIPFPHRDYDRLEELVRRHRGSFNGAAILSDGVFSTRGSVADVDRIVDIAERHRCLSIVDDTHGVLVLGARGRGVVDLYARRPDVLTGGFSKAFGAYGGFALASRALGAALDILGRQNVNTSFLSPIAAAQSLIHLRYYREHADALQAELRGRLRAFNGALAGHGLACYPRPDEHLHPIFCLYKRSESETLACQQELIAEGFFPSFFPPPVAPHPSLRISVHRCLPEAELLRLADTLSTRGLFVDSGGAVERSAPAAVRSRRRDAPRAAVSVSLGSSARDKEVELTLDGEVVSLRREGTDGDEARAARRFAALDGRVDALGLGGFELWVRVDDRRYPLRAGQRLVRDVKTTPVVDGGGLKQTLERRVFERAGPTLGTTRYRRALVLVGADRWGLATAVTSVADEVRFGDLHYGLGLPVTLHSLDALRRTAAVLMPVAGQLPASVLYPTGEAQRRERPPPPALWDGVDLVAGDFHYLRTHLPPSLHGVTVVTNTTTAEDVALLRERGARALVTTTPRFDGRSFGTNALEAALTARAGHGRPLTDAELDAMIDRLDLRPDVLRFAP